MKTYKLTENKLKRIVNEVIKSTLNEGLLDDYQPDYSVVGQTLAELTCKALQSDKENFATCADVILKAYLNNNDKVLQVISNSFIMYMCNWLKRYKPQLYQNDNQ